MLRSGLGPQMRRDLVRALCTQSSPSIRVIVLEKAFEHTADAEGAPQEPTRQDVL
jgi:hypothetical protein